MRGDVTHLTLGSEQNIERHDFAVPNVNNSMNSLYRTILFYSFNVGNILELTFLYRCTSLVTYTNAVVHYLTAQIF